VKKQTKKIFSVWLTCLLLLGVCEPTLSSDAVTPATVPIDNRLLVTVADTGLRSFQRGYHRAGYRVSSAALGTMVDIKRDYALTQIDSWPIPLLGVYCVVVAPAISSDVQHILAQLQRDVRVSLAQPMQTFLVKGDDEKNSAGKIDTEKNGIENNSNDKNFNAKNNRENSSREKNEKSYNDPYFSLQYGKYASQIEQLHRRVTGRGVRVAIVDTGADRTHPDLNGHISIARDFVAAGAIDVDRQFDSDIHGTAVAGIIVAAANNHAGIVGLAPDAEVLMLKACWQLNADEIAARCNSFTLAKALSFAIEQRVDIINLSLGAPADPLLIQLLQVALTRGILIVAAQDPLEQFPAGLPGVIAVNAVAGPDIDAVARTVAINSDIAGAEPRLIVEAQASELLSTSPKGRYDYFSGSSMAAARVTGLSALRPITGNKIICSFGPFLI